MARKWSNLNLPGALHYVTGNFLERTPVSSDDWCWSEDSEKLSKATKERGWYTFEKRKMKS
jgi:hypothetical protein